MCYNSPEKLEQLIEANEVINITYSANRVSELRVLYEAASYFVGGNGQSY